MLPSPLAPLADYPQFVAWRIEMRPNSKSELVPTKVPYSPRLGHGADSTNPAHWGTYDEALEFAQRNQMNGVGFVFTERDPFFFVDIDKSLKEDGTWSMMAQELCARFQGVAVEVSYSGNGLHLIGSCVKGFEHRNKNIPLKIELYTKERFVALTGTHAAGSVTTRADGALAQTVTEFFTRPAAERIEDWTTTPDPEWRGPEDDGALLLKAMQSSQKSAANVFGGTGSNNPTFADLFSANADVLSVRWPPNPNSGDQFDHSSADQSFANLLAFWTGRNCERMERIMRMSALARPKWDFRDHYLSDTIKNAAGLVRKVYQEGGPPRAPVIMEAPPAEELEAAGFSVREGGPLMLYGEQLEYFGGCIYITALNRVLIPGGALLDQARFDVVYGGHDFLLTRDGKKTTTSAWEALTKNHNFKAPTADRACFRPEHGSGGIVRDSGKILANTYFKADTEETEGDPSKMLDHIHKMLPHGQDAELLLTYMASVKQNPGRKTQWWPVIQGAEGNFKTTILNIMCYAVGSHFSHMPNMDKLVSGKSNFNGWIDRKLFLGLEEVKATNRWEFFEGFKSTVTNLFLPIEGKGVEEVTGDNRANGIITTNHQDGVPVIGKTRRYAAFFCAQQTPEDLIRDGMTPAYVSDLIDWVYGSGAYLPLGPNYGLRVMNWWLARKPLDPNLDPNQLCKRCPETSSTRTAMVASRGRIEQEIQEAIEEGRVGFASGWVSSIYLDRLLGQRGQSLAFQKRREVLQSLGFDYHPALPEGRVFNAVQPDGGKPRLFVRMGSPMALLTAPGDISKTYSDAQQKAANDLSKAGQMFSA
jgi:hypothetical protein